MAVMRRGGAARKRKMTRHEFSVVIVREKREHWAYVPGLPGVYGRAKTAIGAKQDIARALKLYMEDCIAAGEPVPKSAAQVVNVDTLSVAVGT